MDNLRQDLFYAFRALGKNRVFTLVVLLTLAIGIGANSAIFSLVDATLLRPLPYSRPDDLVMVWSDYSRRGGPDNEWFSYPDFVDVRTRSQLLDETAAFMGWSPNLTGSGEPERISGNSVSPAYFSLLGARPILGRALVEEDARGDGGRVAVLSYGLWQRRFGGDAGVVGSTLRLNGEPYEVVGVMPPEFQAPVGAPEIWRPLPESFAEGCGRGCIVMRVLGRAKAGTDLGRLNDDLAAVAAAVAEDIPSYSTVRFRAEALRDVVSGDARTPLLVLLGAVGFVLLIACVNVANLLLARAAGREREIAVRTAMGAGRRRLIRQLLTESLLLAVGGGLLGLLVAMWSIDALVAATSAVSPLPGAVGIDARVVGFSMVLSLLTGLAFGLLPAIHSTRANLTGALKEGGSGMRMGRERRRLRSGLVVAQVAIALTLLIGAGLLMKSFYRLQAVDPGFASDGVLAADLALTDPRYEDPAARDRFVAELLVQLEQSPRISAAAVSTVLPLSSRDVNTVAFAEGVDEKYARSTPWYRSVSPGYFQAMGIRLLRGRGVLDSDDARAPLVVVVNETFARQAFGGADPIGRRIRTDEDDAPWRTVVGMVRDVRQRSLDQDPLPEIFYPYAQYPDASVSIVVRGSGEPEHLTSTIRSAVAAADPELPLTNISTMDSRLADSVALPRLYFLLFGIFGAIALTLAAIGIYGVTAHAVGQQTQEIGVRIALGARSGDVLQMVLRRALALAVLGLFLGTLVALALTRTLQSLLFELDATDPATFIVIGVLLLAVSAAAGYVPARRATRVDPMMALRGD